MPKRTYIVIATIILITFVAMLFVQTNQTDYLSLIEDKYGDIKYKEGTLFVEKISDDRELLFIDDTYGMTYMYILNKNDIQLLGSLKETQPLSFILHERNNILWGIYDYSLIEELKIDEVSSVNYIEKSNDVKIFYVEEYSKSPVDIKGYSKSEELIYRSAPLE